jgi:hypothetical protein
MCGRGVKGPGRAELEITIVKGRAGPKKRTEGRARAEGFIQAKEKGRGAADRRGPGRAEEIRESRGPGLSKDFEGQGRAGFVKVGPFTPLLRAYQFENYQFVTF